MTDKTIRPGTTGSGFMVTLDWRKGRTWAAFIGSALAIGCVLSIVLFVVTVFILDMPPSGTSESGWFIRMLLFFVFLVPLVAFLGHMTWRTPQAATKEKAGSDTPLSARVHALDILLKALWLALALLTCAALFRLAGPSHDLFKTDRTGMIAVGSILILIVQDVPALLHRLARPKAPPAPSPLDQADAGGERQP